MKIDDPASSTVVHLLHSALEELGHGEVNLKSLVWEWGNNFVKYLNDEEFPKDAKASRDLRTRAVKFCLMDGSSYRRTYLGPLARCVKPGETKFVIKEVHEGVCDNHSGEDSLILKIIGAGYSWTQMEQDGHSSKKCDKCQHFAQVVHQLDHYT